MPAASLERPRSAKSQTVKAQLRIRERILNGALRPGQRIPELAMVAELGVSRTPVRTALARLAAEGLVEPIRTGGFAVRGFTESDMLDAIELRGTLEGLAARFAAERGVADEALGSVQECLERIDVVIARPSLTADVFSEYIVLNGRFHELVVDLAESDVVKSMIARAAALPFASPAALVHPRFPDPDGPRELAIAQDQHRRVIEAIVAREGARAEAIMREHAQIVKRNLVEVFRVRAGLGLLPANLLVDGDHERDA